MAAVPPLPGGAVDAHTRLVGQLPRECMLPAAAADDEYLHEGLISIWMRRVPIACILKYSTAIWPLSYALGNGRAAAIAFSAGNGVSGKDHGNVVRIGGLDCLVVLNASSGWAIAVIPACGRRLDPSRPGGRRHPIRGRIPRWETALHPGDTTESTRLIWPAPTPDEHIAFGEHDRIGFYMLCHLPGELEGNASPRGWAGVWSRPWPLLSDILHTIPVPGRGVRRGRAGG